MGEMILGDADLMDAAQWPVTVTFGLYDDRDPNCAGVVHGASEGGGLLLQRQGPQLLGRARRVRPGERGALRRGVLRGPRLVQAVLR